MKQLDEDALNVMKQAGQEFAQKQRYRHYGNEWRLPDDQLKERIAHWHAVEVRIGELVSEMKQRLKEPQSKGDSNESKTSRTSTQSDTRLHY